MVSPKDVLVVTSSTVEGLKIKSYLKPVSAHIVAGTNLFSDFFAGFSDVFGGRSKSYQKQLIGLYNEAIEKIKLAAYEIGANCIIGLNIDMDEISGKGKSMFMLTAIGTAIVIEKDTGKSSFIPSTEKFENIGVERINTLRNKKEIIEKANAGKLILNDETWSFITLNQIDEVFPYLLKKFAASFLSDRVTPQEASNFYKFFIDYIDAIPESKKLDLLYTAIKSDNNEQVVSKLSEIIKELNLYDFNKSIELLKSETFQIQKIGLQIVTYDKPFYNKEDIQDLFSIVQLIKSIFLERGKRSMKKQLLSSKEKEVWTCECGKTNDIESYCSGCDKDIYGFKHDEVKPIAAETYLQKKIDLISEYLQ